jgi:hypothetical protein
MTDQEILSFAASNAYAKIYVSATRAIGGDVCSWPEQLAKLTSWQRDALISKIERQRQRMRCANLCRYSENQACAKIQRVAKTRASLHYNNL